MSPHAQEDQSALHEAFMSEFRLVEGIRQLQQSISAAEASIRLVASLAEKYPAAEVQLASLVQASALQISGSISRIIRGLSTLEPSP